MKKILFTLIAMLTMSISAQAMSFEQAQREALFLTDKMAYELNLTQQQYDAAYEINLDYLMGVTSVDDVYGTYWTRRNLDLSYILYDWQWSAFQAASYFYRPLYWDAGFWHFGVYARYPRRSYFYFDRPGVYISYRGGHSWRMNGGRSWYHDRRGDFNRGGNHFGMRDRWNRGDYNRGNRDFGRGSSTRVTVNGNRNGIGNRGFNNNNRGNRFDNNRNVNNRIGGNVGNNRIENNRNSFGTNRNRGSFSNNRQTNVGVSNRSNGSFNRNQSVGSSNRNGNTFGGVGNSPMRNSRSNGNLSAGGNHTSSGSGHFGGGNNFGGGNHSGGGFGGRR